MKTLIPALLILALATSGVATCANAANWAPAPYSRAADKGSHHDPAPAPKPGPRDDGDGD